MRINGEATKQQNRKYYFDILKLFACYCVIVDHTNFFISTGGNRIPQGGIESFFAFLYLTIAHVAVTLFVMISGALLLGKQESYKQCLFRVLKCGLVIAIFTAIHYLCEYGVGNFVFKDLIKHMVCGDYVINYWYLYMYMALLVMLPVLRKMVEKMKDKDYIYLCVLTIICSFDFVTSINEWFVLPLFVPFVGIFIMGFFLDNYDIRKLLPANHLSAKVCFVGSTIGLFADVIFVTVYSLRESALDQTVSNRFFCWDNVFYIYMAAYLIYWTKYICLNKVGKILNKDALRNLWGGGKRLVSRGVYCTYGIYLIHGIITLLLIKYIKRFLDLSVFPQLINWIVLDLCMFTVCGVLVYLIKKISIFRILI